eukprot:scaffold1650_cov135-Cylindrotheca_fusiformis.AAC.6
MAAESIDALIDLMDSLRMAITEGLVDAVSSYGVFLRMVCLGFEELSFESAALLWADLKETLCWSQQMTKGDYNTGESVPWPLSPSQIENTLITECFDQQLGNLTDTDQSFECIELKIQSMMNDSPESPSAYFFRFLNCLHHQERVGAIDALHQYFDQATVQHDSPKDILQFSAIVLAVAHGCFGDTELSLMATEEAVRVAQQSKDRHAACVAFALGWLFENNGHGIADRQELLRRCASRASRNQLRSLVAGANLTLAKHVLEEDHRAIPSSAWTSLMAVTSDQAANSLSSLDRPTHMAAVSNHTMESLARQVLISAAMWDSINQPTLSGLSSMVALNYSRHLKNDGGIAALQNVSRIFLRGASLKLSSDHISEIRTGCIYSQSIASLMRLQADYGLDQGRLEGPFLQTVMLLLHEWAVNRGDLEDARALGLALDSNLHSGLSNPEQLFIDFEIQKCLRLARERQWEMARNTAKKVLQACKKKGLKSHRARIQVNLSSIELESNSNEVMSSLSPLLEVIPFCERYQMDGLHAVALSVLAKVFLRLQNPKRALAILKAVMPTLLQREHVWYQAEGFFTLSKCYLQLANTKNARLKHRHLKSSEMKLARSQLLFERCQDISRLREVSYLQAQVFNLVEEGGNREASSRRFLSMTGYLNSRQGIPSTIMAALSDPVKMEAVLNRSIPFL